VALPRRADSALARLALVRYLGRMNTDRIKTKLGGLALPQKAAIADWHVETGRDSTGDPAVWVFVVVHDDQLRRFQETWTATRHQISDAVAEEAPDAFTYIRMQLESEIRPPVAANG